MRLPVLLLALAAAALVTGCSETGGCIPTRTAAADGQKVDLGTPDDSGVLLATLTAEGMPVPDRTLRFDVLAGGDTVHDEDSSTGDNGVASLDLKRLDPAALAALARADGFRASFAGDDTYCASSDVAEIEVVGGA